MKDVKSTDKTLISKKSAYSVPDQTHIDEKNIQDVIKPSELYNVDPEVQANNILQAFNSRVVKGQETFERDIILGDWVSPGTFILGACNQIPELHPYDGAKKLRRRFNIDPTVNTEVLGIKPITAQFYGAYGTYVLNVPPNSFAKAWSGNIPVLFGTGPHVIHDPNFSFAELVNQSNAYINHGSIHILRVPAGKIAKIWIGTVPYLLESREQPYVFDSSLFSIVQNNQSYFFDATDNYIAHGSIKRIMPHTGTVAVTFNNGILDIYEPNKDKKPIIINSPSHRVSSFLNTNVQAFEFPSEEEKKSRKIGNPNITPDELNHYVYMTKDSLKIGVKLLVSYKVSDPYTLLTQLHEDTILSTVESLAAVDMNKMVNRLSSQEFLNPLNSFRDEVRETLSAELKNYGIELIRFNIETPVFLDKEIAKKMSESAILNAEANAKQAVIEKQAQVQKAEAERDAETKRIRQNQTNDATISAAKAKYEEKKLEAQAKYEAQKLEAEGIILLAQAEQKSKFMMGEVYKQYPELLELKKIEAIAEGLKGGKLIVPFPPQSIQHAFEPQNYSSFNKVKTMFSPKQIEAPADDAVLDVSPGQVF